MFLLRPLLAILFATLALRSACAAEIKPVAPPEAARLVKEGKAILVDVREPPEWRDSGVAEPAVLLPMSDFNGEQRQWKDFLAKNRDKQILLYCRSGGRSAAVAESLVGKGYKAANIGTLRDWTKAGLPVRKVE